MRACVFVLFFVWSLLLLLLSRALFKERRNLGAKNWTCFATFGFLLDFVVFLDVGNDYA